MSTATLALSRRVSKARVTPEERARYLLRINALGWSQNEAARRIKRDPGHFSLWLRGELPSLKVRGLIDGVLARAEARQARAS